MRKTVSALIARSENRWTHDPTEDGLEATYKNRGRTYRIWIHNSLHRDDTRVSPLVDAVEIVVEARN